MIDSLSSDLKAYAAPFWMLALGGATLLVRPPLLFSASLCMPCFAVQRLGSVWLQRGMLLLLICVLCMMGALGTRPMVHPRSCLLPSPSSIYPLQGCAMMRMYMPRLNAPFVGRIE